MPSRCSTGSVGRVACCLVDLQRHWIRHYFGVFASDRILGGSLLEFDFRWACPKIYNGELHYSLWSEGGVALLDWFQQRWTCRCIGVLGAAVARQGWCGFRGPSLGTSSLRGLQEGFPLSMDPDPPPRKQVQHDDHGEPHFLTFSCDRRLPLLSKDRTRQWFVEALDPARAVHGLHVAEFARTQPNSRSRTEFLRTQLQPPE